MYRLVVTLDEWVHRLLIPDGFGPLCRLEQRMMWARVESHVVQFTYADGWQ